MSDIKGIYSYLLKDLTGQPFYIVARAGDLYYVDGEPHISVQKALLIFADRFQYPIVFAWYPSKTDEKPAEMRIFNGCEVRENTAHKHENDRYGVIMVNFPYNLGVPVEDPAQIGNQWKHIIDRWNRDHVTQMKLPGFSRAREAKT